MFLSHCRESKIIFNKSNMHRLALQASCNIIIPQNRQKVKHLFVLLEKILKVRANFYFFIAIIIKA